MGKDGKKKDHYYDRRRLAHVCVRCGAQDAATLSGRSCCAACAQKRKEQRQALREAGVIKPKTDQQRQRERERVAQLKEEWKAAGLCVNCGKRPAMEGHVHCEVCIMRDRQRRRVAHGLPPLPGSEPDIPIVQKSKFESDKDWQIQTCLNCTEETCPGECERILWMGPAKGGKLNGRHRDPAGEQGER